ncbi:MAG: hypothetical protein K2M06_05640 [Muribaculaceae bacterium]|nr:hypothetical protein [Muribaculaceae bacterium]
MKHLSLVALCACAALGASAQTSLIKEAKDAYSKGKSYTEVINLITPAFTNPETAQLAETFYVPGEMAFKEYDELYKQTMVQPSKYSAADSARMGRLLVDGYNYFMKAFPLDSLPNEKGKIKPKFSKNMVNTLANNASAYRAGGIFLYSVNDYQGAYDAWMIYGNLPEMPEVRKKLESNNKLTPGVMPTDEQIGEILYNAGLAAWQMNEFDKAYDAFIKAMDKGYDKKQIYDYAMAVAQQGGHEDKVFELAQKAFPIYGKEDPMYVRLILNHYIVNKDADKAMEIVNEAIANEPENSQYRVFRGIIFESNGDIASAKKNYEEAVAADSRNAQALFYLGHTLYNEASALQDKAPANPSEYAAYFNSTVKPVLDEAIKYLENSVDEEPADTRLDALRTLLNAYYALNDNTNYEYTQKRIDNL